MKNWNPNDHDSSCSNKKLKPELSRISGGGSISSTLIWSIDLERSSTENGMLQNVTGSVALDVCKFVRVNLWYQEKFFQKHNLSNSQNIFNLVSSSSKKELSTALNESSVARNLSSEITCQHRCICKGILHSSIQILMIWY